MPREIEYFLSMASPWAYLGHAAFIELAAKHGATVVCKLLPLRRLFPETGGLPLPKRHPVRQRYRMLELQRWREKRGLPLHPTPRHVPFEPAPLDLMVIAAQAAGHNPDRFMRLAFAAIWAEERDPTDPATLAGLAEAAGLPPATPAQLKAATATYEATLAEALEKGVFGAPSYLLDGEVFWGQDRLDLLADALSSGRALYRS